jgi:hypothetical protein
MLIISMFTPSLVKKTDPSTNVELHEGRVTSTATDDQSRTSRVTGTTSDAQSRTIRYIVNINGVYEEIPSDCNPYIQSVGRALSDFFLLQEMRGVEWFSQDNVSQMLFSAIKVLNDRHDWINDYNARYGAQLPSSPAKIQIDSIQITPLLYNQTINDEANSIRNIMEFNKVAIDTGTKSLVRNANDNPEQEENYRKYIMCFVSIGTSIRELHYFKCERTDFPGASPVILSWGSQSFDLHTEQNNRQEAAGDDYSDKEDIDDMLPKSMI